MLQDSFGISISVTGDTLTTFTRDSFALAVRSDGDKVRELRFSPAAQRQIGAVTTPVARAWAAAAPKLYLLFAAVLAVTLLPIPLAVTTVTLVWRRAWRRASAAIEGT